jgi:rubrerythrin
MASLFTGTEIVELGIQIEKNGRDFYNLMARKVKSPSASEIFKFLSGEEEKHISVFQKILDSLEEYVPQEAYSGEYFAYMNALASEFVFTRQDKAGQVAKTVKSDREALDLSIGAEKDSIIFYEGMKKVVPKKDLSLIEELIAQEQSHLRQLAELKGKV